MQNYKLFLSMDLVKKGYSVHYVCSTKNKIKSNTTSISDGVNIYWKKKIRYNLLRTIFYDIKYFAKHKPDFIIFRRGSPQIISSFFYKLVSNVKLVWICSDDQIAQSNYHSTKVDKSSYILKKGIFLYYLIILYLKICDYFKNATINNCDLIFSQNKVQKEKIKKYYGRDSYKIISGHPHQKNELTAKKKVQ